RPRPAAPSSSPSANRWNYRFCEGPGNRPLCLSGDWAARIFSGLWPICPAALICRTDLRASFMPSLVTRFHLLLVGVTIAITGVTLFHVPEGYAYPAHWQGSGADWLWPRDIAIAVAPLLELVLLAAFHLLGRALTKNHFAKVQHILDPALTLLLSVLTACQLGLLLSGIGSDFDLFRITAGALAATLLVLAVVIFEAERHSYAGLRM